MFSVHYNEIFHSHMAPCGPIQKFTLMFGLTQSAMCNIITTNRIKVSL
jgi:hypothetical protein